MAEIDGKIVVMLVLICCSTVIGIIGVVIGAVNLSRGGSGGGRSLNIYVNSSGQPFDPEIVSYTSSGDRVWMIAIGHYDNRVEYLDPVSYQIKGYDVDVVDAVCDIANKNCELVNDPYEHCWNSEAGQRARGGIGLMSGWYDACTGWSNTFTRQLTFDFTVAFQKSDLQAIYVKNESALTYPNLGNIVYGFLDGWSTDEYCLGRYDDDGLTGLPLDQARIAHFQKPEDLINGVLAGTVDAVFAKKLTRLDNSLKRITTDAFPNYCVSGGLGMMTRKKNVEFLSWWNDAFNRLVGTKRYDDICQDLVRAHANIPGDDPMELCIGY